MLSLLLMAGGRDERKVGREKFSSLCTENGELERMEIGCGRDEDGRELFGENFCVSCLGWRKVDEGRWSIGDAQMNSTVEGWDEEDRYF